MSNKTNKHANKPSVLVTDVHAAGMIGVIRSLGRAGYCVHAIAEKPNALGLYSNFASYSAIHPSIHTDDFFSWLDNYLANHNIRAIVPSEGFLHVIADRFEQYKHLLPDAVPLEVWQRCMSKVATQLCLHGSNDKQLRQHLPPGGIIEHNGFLPTREAIEKFNAPYYLKADAGQALREPDAIVRRCVDADQLLKAAEELQPQYRNLLWQGHGAGKKVGVSLFRHQGEFLAENMTLGIHMQPHTGGMMSLRKSWWHEQLLADAKRKLEALGWQGVAMMEYTWDPASDEFWFIEINARYWGYLHQDLFVGKDFPAIQLDTFFGDKRYDLGPAKKSASCRHTVPGEIGYVLSKLRDPHTKGMAKLVTLFGFFIRFFNPTQHSDLLFPGDRKLYWIAWQQFIKNLGRAE